MRIQRNLKNRNAVTLETRSNVKLSNYIGLLIEINNGNIYCNFTSIKWQLFPLYLNKRHSFPHRSCTAMSPWLNIPVKKSLPWKKETSHSYFYYYHYHYYSCQTQYSHFKICTENYYYYYIINRVSRVAQWVKKKVKQSHYTPWRRLGGEEV
jgi:hypothetical protein